MGPDMDPGCLKIAAAKHGYAICIIRSLSRLTLILLLLYWCDLGRYVPTRLRTDVEFAVFFVAMLSLLNVCLAVVRPAIRPICYYFVGSITGSYPVGSYGELLVQGKRPAKQAGCFSNLCDLLLMEALVPELVTHSQTINVLHSWPGSSFSLDGTQYGCSLCNCLVPGKDTQWWQHVCGFHHQTLVQEQVNKARCNKVVNIFWLPLSLIQQQSRFPELHKLWHELTLDTAPWDHYGTIVTLSLPPTQLLFIPQALKQLRNFEELHLTLTGCPTDELAVPSYCYALTQSLCLLLVFLHKHLHMTTLKLDFSQFNQIVKLNDDANVVLTCLWTQLETFLNNNGLVRYIKLTKPPCSAQWETRFQAASAIGYKTRKDDMTMMLLRGMRGRSSLASALRQLPTEVVHTIVLKAMPPKPCKIKCKSPLYT